MFNKKVLSMLASVGLANSPQFSEPKVMKSKRTGVITLESMFPNIGKAHHRNGRSNNIDGRFPIQSFKYPA